MSGKWTNYQLDSNYVYCRCLSCRRHTPKLITSKWLLNTAMWLSGSIFSSIYKCAPFKEYDHAQKIQCFPFHEATWWVCWITLTVMWLMRASNEKVKHGCNATFSFVFNEHWHSCSINDDTYNHASLCSDSNTVRPDHTEVSLCDQIKAPMQCVCSEHSRGKLIISL